MRRVLCALALIAAPLAASGQSYPEAKSIVAIGGPVTETIFALGEGHRVVARDSTSLFPAEVTALPEVGYMRQLSAEGLLSVGPDLIITRDTAGPPEVLDQLRAASIPMVETRDAFSADAVSANVRVVGAALGVGDKAETLARTIEADFAELAAAAAQGAGPRVMFILSNQGGRLNVAGGATGADGILTLAGAVNVFAADYSGYKIASDEAIIAAAPDVILMMKPTGEEAHDTRRADILALAAVSQTPAGQGGHVVMVDPAALGFGPRTAALALQLRADLLAAAE